MAPDEGETEAGEVDLTRYLECNIRRLRSYSVGSRELVRITGVVRQLISST